MHATDALTGLLQAFESLSAQVQQFSSATPIHPVEKEQLLHRSRLLHEALLGLQVVDADDLAAKAAEAQSNAADELKAISEELEKEVAKARNKAEAALNQLELEMIERKRLLQEKYAAESAKIEQERQVTAANSQEVHTSQPEAAEESETNSQLEEEPRPDLLREETTKEEMVAIERIVLEVPSQKDKPAKVQYENFSIEAVLNASGEKDLILTHLKLKPIQDLKTGIGLNEKFLFIRELFANDHQAYAEAVDQLNAKASVADAELYIAGELLPRYGWNLEHEALVNFLHLIFRRFSN